MQGIADYQFLRPVVEGSRGSVYLAVPPARLGLDCAHVGVKVVVGPTSEDSLRRATRELRAFASAQSPFLVKLLDAGQQDGTFFYSMEYCQLGSLAQPARPLSRAEVVVAVAQAARAAHALHEAGLVHRSIKPANILLRDDGARLSDLGLVQTLSPGQTITGFGPVGDVEFVEPSILLGQPGSRASDVWSLGATLHRAITGDGIYGELPADDPLLCIRRVLGNRPRLSSRLSGADAEVIGRCLAVAAADRPRDALSLAQELEKLH
jgi:serine/threonine protein kinase